MGELAVDLGIPVPFELFTNFNEIKFHDDIHKYYLGTENLISVTTKLHKFVPEFDQNYWADYKKTELGMTQEEVLKYWKALNVKSQLKGSAVHNYAELLFNNKVYKYDDDAVLAKLGEESIGFLNRMGEKPIKEEFDIVKTYVDKFYADTYNKLIPIKTEFIMFDREWKLAGMMDILFWNVKKRKFQVWDWKTNKKVRKKSDYGNKMKGLLAHIDDCEFEIYSLQLSTYKRMLERNTPIEIDACYIVWLNETNPSYEIMQCKDYSSEVNMIMSGDF